MPKWRLDSPNLRHRIQNAPPPVCVTPPAPGRDSGGAQQRFMPMRGRGTVAGAGPAKFPDGAIGVSGMPGAVQPDFGISQQP